MLYKQLRGKLILFTLILSVSFTCTRVPTHSQAQTLRAPKHSGQDYFCAKQQTKDISSQVLYTSLGLFVTGSDELVSDFFSGPLGNERMLWGIFCLTILSQSSQIVRKMRSMEFRNFGQKASPGFHFDTHLQANFLK